MTACFAGSYCRVILSEAALRDEIEGSQISVSLARDIRVWRYSDDMTPICFVQLLGRCEILRHERSAGLRMTTGREGFVVIPSRRFAVLPYCVSCTSPCLLFSKNKRKSALSLDKQQKIMYNTRVWL